MEFRANVAGQVMQLRLPKAKALWPLFETVVNSIQAIEELPDCDHPEITILAIRNPNHQMNTNNEPEPTRFHSFVVTDNGVGFTEENYESFLTVYSAKKIAKGCKGIGRLLWLKAFDHVKVDSVFLANGIWLQRHFCFDLKDLVSPEKNLSDYHMPNPTRKTVVTLEGLREMYEEEVSYDLESLAKRIIEHCLPYFVVGTCPAISLADNEGQVIDLNKYYSEYYQDSLHQDEFSIGDYIFKLYHMTARIGIDKHELHLCAGNREVVSYDLAKYIPNLGKRINSEEASYYYVGYLAGSYLDSVVNSERTMFSFSEAPLVDAISEDSIIKTALDYIRLYLFVDLKRIDTEKRNQIDNFVQYKKPQFRYLLNAHPEIYDAIPAGLPEDRLDAELYRHEQQWEAEVAEQRRRLEEQAKGISPEMPDLQCLFHRYCSSVTQLSQASLTEYVVRRKAVLELLEQALEKKPDGKYSLESRVHSIICPMRSTSDSLPFEDMNLWLIDDRLSYHHFLASDIPFRVLPIIESDSSDRMDIAVFDKALSYSPDPESISSITIIELKRPQRNDLADDDKNPINQVLRYVAEIKSGRAKKSNGRGFGNVESIAFYCYIIADLTDSLIEAAENAGLTRTPDRQGFFGHNSARGAYIEVISYDKLLSDAKKRNEALFDRLFRPKSENLTFFIGAQS